MWLLSTSRAELRFFAATAAVTGGYAILSHTWSSHEDSFQDIRLIEERCKLTSENPRDLVSPKIRHCCLVAESHGYSWLWIDSCCIDKTSSSELTEALNSMFRWYSQAEVCYALLEDVSSACVLDAPDSDFRRSRYHTRGWTLQELIAPQLVIFFSREWQQLGVKSELGGLLEEVTGVSRKVLTGESHFSKYSLAVRMSWASGRSTTRLEDEAYCLMGLFGVNMPALYGEGRQAFQRLQCEIVKQSVDTSLFAWGKTVSQVDLRNYTSHHTNRAANCLNDVQYLFAPSPSSFQAGCAYYTPRLKKPLQPYLAWQWKKAAKRNRNRHAQNVEHPFGYPALPRFTITNYGVKCHFPIIEADGFVVAVLLCEKGGEHLGLLLHKSRNPFQDPSRPLYFVSDSLQRKDGTRERVRMISLGKDMENLQLNGQIVAAEWRTIYIAQSPGNTLASSPAPSSVPTIMVDRGRATTTMAFHIPQWLLARFSALGFHSTYSRSDDSSSTTRVRFHNWERGEHIYVDMGTCNGQQPGPASCWARVVTPHADGRSNVPQADVHQCGEHHIDAWSPGRSRLFGDSERAVRISFAPSKLDPAGTLLVHLELLGTVFVEMLARAKITIPPACELRGPLAPPPAMESSTLLNTPTMSPLEAPSKSHVESNHAVECPTGVVLQDADSDGAPESIGSLRGQSQTT
ncbi:HET-domain-containing protein [Lentinus tigrinus ALCF2SS1-7]|uniref:HET-domain-containing protein n=1 Tax=Lentinus tigrinus ALCF2SS1-7 TaxID=1328758 RepID=UPI001165D527|nr:HET-domain-containing protein [Lentinus tigrinus ALCF2SS1-7]